LPAVSARRELATSLNSARAASRSSTISAAEDGGIGEVGGIERFVAQTEQVEAHLVARDQFAIREAMKAFALGALMAVLRVVARDEIAEMFAPKRLEERCLV